MQQPNPNYNEFLLAALHPMTRQLDRLEERTRDLATRTDLEALRKELVARDSLEPQLTALRNQIVRVDTDRTKDREAVDERIDELEKEQISRQDRLWMRLGPAAAFGAFLLALFDFLSRLRVIP